VVRTIEYSPPKNRVTRTVFSQDGKYALVDEDRQALLVLDLRRSGNRKYLGSRRVPDLKAQFLGRSGNIVAAFDDHSIRFRNIGIGESLPPP
jgi:hypothetical protein